MEALEGVFNFYPTTLAQVYDENDLRDLLKNIACEELVERIIDYNE